MWIFVKRCFKAFLLLLAVDMNELCNKYENYSFMSIALYFTAFGLAYGALSITDKRDEQWKY